MKISKRIRAKFRGPLDRRRLVASAPKLAADLPERLRDVDARSDARPRAGTPHQPVFILSAGWRSGSTLLQRMVMLDGSVLIWGEPFDRARIIQTLADQWRGFTRDWPPENYFAGATPPDVADSWVANLYPETEALREGQVLCVERLFGEPAARRNFKRWGLKEVRLTTDHAVYLRWLFPDAKFLFIYRNPAAAYASYKPYRNWFFRWPDQPILTPLAFGRIWHRMVLDFLDNHGRVGGLLVRYEDLNDQVPRIREYLGIDVPMPKDLAVVRQQKESTVKNSLSLWERVQLYRATSDILQRAGFEVTPLLNIRARKLERRQRGVVVSRIEPP